MRGWHLAVPGALTLFLAFRAGGFFAGTSGLAAGIVSVALALRLAGARSPLAGWSPGLSVASAGLATLAIWTLLSSVWSDAPGRAMVEFDRVLLYLGLLVFMGTFVRRPHDLAVALRWVALALAAVCVAGVLTKLLPRQLPTATGLLAERLAFPVTYWNAMGLVGALGVVLGLHFTASNREPAGVRVLAAGLLPAVTMALYFTFSRGPIALAVVGCFAYVALARPRGLAAALLGAGLPTFYALHEAYGAELLADPRVKAAATSGQGQHVLIALVVATLAALVIRTLTLSLDRRLERVAVPRRRRRAVLAATACLALAGLALASVAFDLPRRIDEQRRAFVEGNAVTTNEDLRARLTQTGNNGRLAFWGVARDAFEQRPLLGTGAGTYRLRWEHDRSWRYQINDAHSLYLEVAGELGAPGLLMLLVALGAVLWAGLRRLRGSERHTAAAFACASGVLLVHAGVDWDWEMPVLFAWFFGVGGIALARATAPDRQAGWSPVRLSRLLAGLACLFVAVTPLLVAVSQQRLKRSVQAFKRGDCATAIDAALGSIDAVSARAEPYELLGYCDARAGQNGLAVRAMQAARARDPGNWQFAYGLAVTEALAGRDPRAAAELARRLNPHEPLAARLEKGLRSRSPARRRQVAARADIPFE